MINLPILLGLKWRRFCHEKLVANKEKLIMIRIENGEELRTMNHNNKGFDIREDPMDGD